MQAYFDSAPNIPLFLQKPCVEDLGDGPRVRDMPAFLHSPVAAPPSREDALCAEFAQEEILEMLGTILPEETAMVRVQSLRVAVGDVEWGCRWCGIIRAG